MQNGKRKLRTTRIRPAAAYAVSLGISVFFLWKFAFAAQDGFSRQHAGEMAAIDPTYEDRDGAGAPAVPDFTLEDRYHNKVSLRQFADADLLVLNIWSSQCPPCIEEMPFLAEMDKRLGSLGKAAMITITVDREWRDVAEIFPGGTDLRILFDPETKVTEGIFGTVKFPETFILDKKRRIRARFDGVRDWPSPLIMDYIKSFN